MNPNFPSANGAVPNLSSTASGERQNKKPHRFNSIDATPDMRPLGGEFVHSREERHAACAKAAHPTIYLNLSESARLDRNVKQCHCGQVVTGAETPEERREKRRARREKVAV